jgi:hypothetical protein
MYLCMHTELATNRGVPANALMLPSSLVQLKGSRLTRRVPPNRESILSYRVVHKDCASIVTRHKEQRKISSYLPLVVLDFAPFDIAKLPE